MKFKHGVGLCLGPGQKGRGSTWKGGPPECGVLEFGEYQMRKQDKESRSGRGTKMVEYKDVLSLPLARTPESQLAAGQSSTGRHWNSPKKIPHIQRHRRSHSEMCTARGAIAIKSNPIHAGWVTHKLENNYTTEVLPQE